VEGVTAIVTRGDAAHLHLPDETVDLVVTSPPYFGLRSYQDGGEHYDGQVGDEATPGEYLDALIACTAEWVRVLKPGGSIFVNLGDKYSGAQQQNSGRQSAEASSLYWQKTNPRNTGIPAKSLMGFPWRYALRCIDDLGLILRAEIVWSKPNGLPESVTDRVRRSHEQVFHFVKQPRYYSAVDEVREEAQQGRPQAARAQALAARHGLTQDHRDALLSRGLGDQGRSAATQSGTGKNTAEVLRLAAEADAALGSYTREFTMTSQALGKLPGSVWDIPTAPLTVPDHLGVDHFAAYPPELVRRIVLGWSPREVCTACGEGRRPVSTAREVDGHAWAQPQQFARMGDTMPNRRTPSALGYGAGERARTVTGYACACPDTTAPATPGVVLDPFGGTGTTALVASAYGRVGISVDLSADYCRLARWRTTDPGERARVLGVAKPEPVPEGQMGLFEGLGA
jgi:DNA modification methylase